MKYPQANISASRNDFRCELALRYEFLQREECLFTVTGNRVCMLISSVCLETPKRVSPENMKKCFQTKIRRILWSIYRVSIKSLYNFKNLLQQQLMRYLHQICSTYSVIIKVFITLHFRYLMNKMLLTEPLTNTSREGRRSVYHDLLKPNRIRRLSEN